MKIQEIFDRSKGMLINPVSEFKIINSEERSIKRINFEFVLPIAVIIGLASMVQSSFSNIPSSINNIAFIIIDGIITLFLVLSHAYLTGKLIASMAGNMDDTSKSDKIYALVIYSQVPFYLILTLTKLFPSLIFLFFLAIYSALIFHTGTGILTRLNSRKRMQFMLLSIILMIISFILLSELYTLLYSEIIDQFSTFAA